MLFLFSNVLLCSLYPEIWKEHTFLYRVDVDMIVWLRACRVSLCDLSMLWCFGSAHRSRTGEQMWTDKTSWPMNDCSSVCSSSGKHLRRSTVLLHRLPFFDVTSLSFTLPLVSLFLFSVTSYVSCSLVFSSFLLILVNLNAAILFSNTFSSHLSFLFSHHLSPHPSPSFGTVQLSAAFSIMPRPSPDESKVIGVVNLFTQRQFTAH